MTLSRSNPHAKPRWFALLVLVCIGLALAATAVSALTTANPPSLTFVNDENLGDDQPGQKDLSAHAVNFNPSTGDLWVAWKWDVTKLSGGNTGDACALFDTDADNKINFAVCVTIGGDPAAQLTSVGSPRIYTCGDAKVDRCTSPVNLVPTPGSYSTACSVNQAGVDRSDPFHSGQLDTTALCHIDLAEVGATAASLVNTCSYPSQQPNSDPSDCVLIPRDAFLIITKVASPNQGSFPFHVDGSATATFTAAGSQSSSQIAIRSDITHSVREAVPTNWAITGTPSCTGTSGPGSSPGTYSAATSTISGIDASPDNIVTCTFNDQLQTGSIVVTKVDGANVLLAGAGFTIDPSPTTVSTADDIAMTEYAAGVFCTDNLPFASYTVTETTVPPGYNGASPATVTVSTVSTCASRIDGTTGLPTGATDSDFTNSPAPGTITVQKNDDDEVGLAGVGFTLYVDEGSDGIFDPAIDLTIAAAEVNTDSTGLATFSSIPPGDYCAVETSPLDGYAAANPNYVCGTLSIGAGTILLGTLANEQEHTVIVLVCHDATDTLAPSDVTFDPGTGDETKTSLAAGALTAEAQKALCDLGGATWGGLVHGDIDLSVDVGSDAH